MIETRLLQYFLAVARELNITKAAETLFIAQPTLSKQMMELEQQLGKQLFIRGMENTEAAFHTEETMLSGHITIGCGETVAMDRIAFLLSDFHGRYPDVQLHTHSGDADIILERLDKGLVDMGLLLGPVRQEKYDYLNLRQKDVYGLLMPADCELAEQEAINIDQLKSLPMIMSEQTFSGHQELEWFGSDYSVMNVVATYNLIYNATFLVEHGIGYALCLDRLVNTQGRNLTFRPIVPELSVDLYMVTKKYQTLSPAAKIFLKQVQDSI